MPLEKSMSVSKYFVLMLMVAGAGTAAAQPSIVSPGSPVTITQSYAYSNYDGGDFVFSTSVAAPGCASGWYVKPTDGGYKSIVATVLTAQAVGLQVVVYGDSSDIWTGSPTGQYCRVQAVGLSG